MSDYGKLFALLVFVALMTWLYLTPDLYGWFR